MTAAMCLVFVSPNHHIARSAAPSDHLRVVLQLPSCNHFWTTLNDPPPCVGQPWNPLGIRPESGSFNRLMNRLIVQVHEPA